MTNENKDKLKELLIEWFKDCPSDAKHFWSENKIASIIKSNLKNLSHWKNKSKGRQQSNLKQLEIARQKKLSKTLAEANEIIKESKEDNQNNW